MRFASALWTLTFGMAAVSVSTLGCSSGAVHDVVLAEYDFREARQDEIYGSRWGADTGVHWLAEGWSPVKGGGVWTLGETARMHLWVLGSEAVLYLQSSTSPALAKEGQTLAVAVNGEECGRFQPGDNWSVDQWQVRIPDEILRQGLNEVAFLPSHRLSEVDPESDPRPLGIFLRTLRLTARLSDAELKRWNDRTRRPPPDPLWSSEPLSPEIVASIASATAGASPSPTARPDVLLILLDAARADHFGCYGYPRNTTPVCDALARDGVRLENVMAEASYTLASVPTILTGTSWRDHKVTSLGNALSGPAVTLAEILKTAGYQTLGISSNTNVSIATGASQGFDAFVEIWKSAGWIPETLNEVFEARVAQGFDERPVFAFLHLFPPHSPYFPGEGNDLWKPEGYDGDLRGTFKEVMEFDRGDRPAEGPDFDRLVSLYDGRLRRGDSAVGRILEAWRSLARPRETMVIVLSDHGEGFGEHGRFDHNATVYDEMLHVPVILHPARMFPGLAESDGRLRGLSDVMPTLLHYLGIAPPAGTSWPARFARVLEDPSAQRSAVFTRGSQPLFGLRTSASLTVFRIGRTQELYDLGRDPASTHNLRLADPDRFAQRLTQIRAFLENPAGLAPAEANLSEEDRRALEALGYIDQVRPERASSAQ